MKKKLYRSREHRVVSGVLGGLGEYFDTDPVILRLILVLITIATGVFPGIIAYVIGVFMVPETPVIAASREVQDDDSAI